MDKRLNNKLEDESRLEDVVTNINIDVTLSMYIESTTEIPKIHAFADMSSFQANLTAFTYDNLQKIGNCFMDKESDKLRVQKRS